MRAAAASSTRAICHIRTNTSLTKLLTLHLPPGPLDCSISLSFDWVPRYNEEQRKVSVCLSGYPGVVFHPSSELGYPGDSRSAAAQGTL